MAEPSTTKVKKPRRPMTPRPLYLVYSISDNTLVVHAFSRKTDDVLSALDSNTGAKVQKLMAPSGR